LRSEGNIIKSVRAEADSKTAQKEKRSKKEKKQKPVRVER